MTDPDAEIKAMVTQFLTSCGLEVEEIPREHYKTPDLLINSGQPDATLIELKTKGDDPVSMSELNEELDQDGVVTRSQATNYWNTLDGIISSGVKQMRTKDPTRTMNRLLWVHCSGFDAHLHDIRLKATIYGTQKLFSDAIPNIITCFYFWDSSFFKHRADLDGVIISRGDQAQLNLNDKSNRFGHLINSGLARAFATGVFHPQQFPDDQDMMIHDGNLPRNGEKDALEYLRKKYRLDHLQTIDMGMHSGIIRTKKS